MKNFKITIKFFSGLDQEAQIENYNQQLGYSFEITAGSRLRKVIKNFGLNRKGAITFYRDGEKIGKWSKLRDGDTISCFRPTGGG